MSGQIPGKSAKVSRPGEAPWRVSKALRALRGINSVIIGAGDEQLLLQDVCKAMVDTAGYRSAWVVYPDEGGEALRAVASWGAAEGAFERLEVAPADEEGEKTSVAEALRRGRPWVVPSPGPDKGVLAVLPLESGSGVAGALLVRGGDAGAFYEAELELLQEAAKSLAYSIASLRSAAQRARAEEELRRVNRARKTLSAVNRALVRAGDEQALLGEICRIIVEEGGYRYAWVGYAQHDDAKSVEVMAHVGVERAHIEGLRVTWADTERGRGVTGVAAFSVGRAVPVVIGASAMGWLEGRAGLRRSQRVLEIAGGLVLILSGLYMLNAYFFFVPGLAA